MMDAFLIELNLFNVDAHHVFISLASAQKKSYSEIEKWLARCRVEKYISKQHILCNKSLWAFFWPFSSSSLRSLHVRSFPFFALLTSSNTSLSRACSTWRKRTCPRINGIHVVIRDAFRRKKQKEREREILALSRWKWAKNGKQRHGDIPIGHSSAFK